MAPIPLVLRSYFAAERVGREGGAERARPTPAPRHLARGMWDSGPQPGAGAAAPGSASCCRRGGSTGSERRCPDRLRSARIAFPWRGFPWHSSARLFSTLSGTAQPGSVRLRSARLSTGAATGGCASSPALYLPPEGNLLLLEEKKERGGRERAPAEPEGREVGAGSAAGGGGSRALVSGNGPHAAGGICWLIPLLETPYGSSGERGIMSVHQTAWLYPRVRVRVFAFFGNTCLAPNAGKGLLFSVGMVINSIAIILSFPRVITI